MFFGDPTDEMVERVDDESMSNARGWLGPVLAH